MFLVVLGFVGRHIYIAGVLKGRQIGAEEEAARWKKKEDWKVEEAEKHV